MAEDAVSADRVAPVLDGAGLQIAIVCGRFNDRITHRLLEGVRRGLASAGVAEAVVTVAWVPGAFELPFMAKVHAETGRFDAVIVLAGAPDAAPLITLSVRSRRL